MKYIPILLLILTNLCFSSSYDSINNLCIELEKEYKEFGVLIISCDTGKTLFCYNTNIIYHKIAAPGSTIKPFSLIALSKTEVIDPNKQYKCPEWGQDPDNIHLCWHQLGHENIDLYKALAFSCNYYFRELLCDTFRQEAFVNTLASYRIIKSVKSIDVNVDLRDSAVGFDSYIHTNPYRMLYAYVTFINGGKLFNRNGDVIDFRTVDDSLLTVIFSGMKSSYKYGTSSLIKEISGYKKGMAKTGTAMRYDKGKWYRNQLSGMVVLLFPSDNSKTGMIVFVQEGKGNKEASEIAGKVLKEIKYEE